MFATRGIGLIWMSSTPVGMCDAQQLNTVALASSDQPLDQPVLDLQA